MEEQFRKRINYYGDIKDISLQICKDYNLGEFKSNGIILVGYEDFNFMLQTSKKKYFIKVFSDFRTLEDCYRYIEIMEKAIEAKIATPKLYKSKQGSLYLKEINKTKLRLCVMEFIEGKTIYEIGEQLTNKEVRFISKQAVLINSINIKPRFIYDTWAITNFLAEFEKRSSALTKEGLKLIVPLVNKFKELKIEKLPHCFVHGDILVTNVIKDNKNKLWIVDFSVSNYYPRIQELAVLACNLFFDESSKEKSEKNLKIALEEYQKTVLLTKEELAALPTYVKLAHTMHLLCANYEKVANNNLTKENDYWTSQGRKGLKQ